MSQSVRDDEQNRLILDQFTRQAKPFAEFRAHSAEDSMALVRNAVGLNADDTVLDLACGPGLVACDFAGRARHVTGIDLTPAMIDQARALQQSKGLTNLDWHVGDVTATLPFADASFTLAITRYSFHHLLHPAKALNEMARVTRPGGRIAVIDVYSSSPEQAAAYDRAERLRDPSHVHALGLDEHAACFLGAGLPAPEVIFDAIEVDLESLLSASFPGESNAEQLRLFMAEDIGRDETGMKIRRNDQGKLRFTFPLVILVAPKAG